MTIEMTFSKIIYNSITWENKLSDIHVQYKS